MPCASRFQAAVPVVPRWTDHMRGGGAVFGAGITEMNAYMEKEEAKKLKQKQRDRMSAKTGKMDIAYEVSSSAAQDSA